MQCSVIRCAQISFDRSVSTRGRTDDQAGPSAPVKPPHLEGFVRMIDLDGVGAITRIAFGLRLPLDVCCEL